MSLVFSFPSGRDLKPLPLHLSLNSQLVFSLIYSFCSPVSLTS